MNTGIISTRYARALLKYTQQTGGAERVARQARLLLAHPETRPNFLEPELERFSQLLIRNGRISDVRLILNSFVNMYYKSIGIEPAILRSAVPLEGLEDRIRKALEWQFGSKVMLETRIEPGLIGGFVVEINDRMLDASVRSQLELIRREFIIKNTRIV